MIRGLLFDAVGTVIALREPVGETYGRFAAEHGIRLPAWRLEDGFQRILRGAPPMAFPGEPPERVRELERDWWRQRVRQTFKATDQTARFADFDAYFGALFAHYAGAGAWQPSPGAVETLSQLRAEGRRLAVASNFDHRLAPVLEALELMDFFDAALGPAELGAAKPDPAFFHAALARLGWKADETAYVGDDPEQDGAAAHAAGLHAVVIEPPATLRDLPARIRTVEEDA